MINARLLLAIILFLFNSCICASAQSRVERGQIESKQFLGNKIGISQIRNYRVYLPSGYDASNNRYPVLYFLHTFFEDEKALFEKYKGKALLDKAIVEHALGGLIVVAADFSTPLGGGFYTSSPVTGDWLAFMVEELVPHIDRSFRTIDSSASRGIFGHHAGGYGAIRFASRHPNVFGLVYAMHPVATGHGNILMQSRPDWDRYARAQSLDDIKGDPISQIFAIIYQANLPNPDNPPLFFDAPAKRVDGKLIIDAVRTEKLQQSFFLEREVGSYAANLRALKAFKFDWGRHDGNQDHVYSNQFYSRKLNEFGIPHQAEEYNGGWDDGMFEVGGRLDTDVLPFFQRHLKF